MSRSCFTSCPSENTDFRQTRTRKNLKDDRKISQTPSPMRQRVSQRALKTDIYRKAKHLEGREEMKIERDIAVCCSVLQRVVLMPIFYARMNVV